MNMERTDSGNKDDMKVHIMYDNEPTLTELSFLLDTLNKGINDYLRTEYNISNYRINEYSPRITRISDGSIIIIVNINLIIGISKGIVITKVIETLYKYISKRFDNESKKRVKSTRFKMEITILKCKLKIELERKFD